MATHSSVLAWGIPGMGEPGGLPSMGSHRVGQDWSDLAAAAVHTYVLVCFSPVWLFATLWTVARKASQSMEFSRQEYWNGLPFPSPGNLPDPGIKPLSLTSPALAGRFFTTSTTWEAQGLYNFHSTAEYNSIRVPIVYKPGNTGTYLGAKRCKIFQKGAKISWSKGIEMHSLFSYRCGIMSEISVKRYLKITHVFKYSVTFTKKDLCNSHGKLQ